MDDAVLATITANVEKNFGKGEDLAHQDAGYTYEVDFQVEGSSETHHYELTVLDSMEFTNEYGDTVKAVAFEDQYGNIYVHYNGTGDGNWGYNSVAYGGGPSKVQSESLEFFDHVMSEYGADADKVYVTGHSQGGNNAQYVTMNSEYGDRIDMCMAMDAPGFSHEAVERMKNRYGEDYYESQRQKIYSYNGSSDYVDPLGNEIIAPQDDEHLTIIYAPDGGLMGWHMIEGMMDGNNLNPRVDDYDPFHKFVVEVNRRVNELPPDQRERVAELGMKVAEYFLGGEGNANWKSDLTLQDLAELAEYVLPILAQYMVEDPEAFRAMFEQLGLPEWFVDYVFPICVELARFAITVAEALKALAEAVDKLIEYLRGITPGGRYVDDNPYFKADPEKLKNYATRLDRVNQRLVQLDKDLDSLYWQVGLVDLGEIASANLITSYSTNLLLAKSFLNKAAEKLEAAERKAKGYMGG